VEHRRAAISTIQDMVGVTSDLAARNPRHESHSVGEDRVLSKRKVACPLFLSPFSVLVGVKATAMRPH
jgi:hypothetical protein